MSVRRFPGKCFMSMLLGSLRLMLVGLLLAATPVFAQATPRPPGPSASILTRRGEDWATRLMRRIDRDRRGYFTEPDAVDYAARRFRQMDRNDNGQLTREEFLGTLPRRLERADQRSKARLERAVAARERLFATLDRQHQGTITRDAYLAVARERFADLDRRHDGRVTVDELRLAGHGI